MVAARTAPNRGVRFGGEHDSLDERGRRDATALAAALGTAVTAAVRAGPETSVTQTADRAVGRYTVAPALASLEVGRWRGLGPETVAAADLAAWFTDPDWRGHGGESVRDFLARIRAAVSTLRGEDPATRTLVVAGPVAQALLCGDVESFFATDVVPARRYVVDL